MVVGLSYVSTTSFLWHQQFLSVFGCVSAPSFKQHCKKKGHSCMHDTTVLSTLDSCASFDLMLWVRVCLVLCMYDQSVYS